MDILYYKLSDNFNFRAYWYRIKPAVYVQLKSKHTPAPGHPQPHTHTHTHARTHSPPTRAPLHTERYVILIAFPRQQCHIIRTLRVFFQHWVDGGRIFDLCVFLIIDYFCRTKPSLKFRWKDVNESSEKQEPKTRFLCHHFWGIGHVPFYNINIDRPRKRRRMKRTCSYWVLKRSISGRTLWDSKLRFRKQVIHNWMQSLWNEVGKLQHYIVHVANKSIGGNSLKWVAFYVL